MKHNENVAGLVSALKWSRNIGVTPTTLWRWRRKGLIKTINIYGRLYLTVTEIDRFNQRAQDGEFAATVNVPFRKSPNIKTKTRA
jgi:predicted site-specific integrase-resolvase